MKPNCICFNVNENCTSYSLPSAVSIIKIFHSKQTHDYRKIIFFLELARDKLLSLMPLVMNSQGYVIYQCKIHSVHTPERQVRFLKRMYACMQKYLQATCIKFINFG